MAAQNGNGTGAGQPTTAVILSGGGATGAYEVGVLKALCGGKSQVTQFQALSPDIFSGTSIGSFNAAVLVSHSRADQSIATKYLEELWLNVIPRDGTSEHNHVFRFRADPLEFLRTELLMRASLTPFEEFVGDAAFLTRSVFNRTMQFFQSKESFGRRVIECFDLSSFITNEPTTRLIGSAIDPANVLASPRILKMAATNWSTGGLSVFTNHIGTDKTETLLEEETTAEAVLSSTAIPGVFSPVQIADAHYVDGGVVMNTPLTPAIHAGAETLHLIYLDPNISSIPLTALQSTVDVMSRLLVIQFATSMNADIEAARRINRNLTALDRFRAKQPAGAESEACPGFNDLVDEILGVQSRKFHKLTIHRYHPHDDLSGILGLLNFEKDRIAALIERGYRDAIHHDCHASQCVMPDGSYA